MINQTITWSFFYKDDAQFRAEDIGIKELKEASFEIYLQDLMFQKKRLDKEGITHIAVYHTLLYEGQCNTEFSPKIISLLKDLNATFCISADEIKTTTEANLYDILDKMRERPALYTGEHSLSAIYHFINGFYMAHNHKTFETPSFDGFNDFVGKFYGKYTTAGWKNLILADHFGNEEEALTRFYVLLDEFRETSNKPNSRAIVVKLLDKGIADLAEITEHKTALKDLLHLISSQLNTAIYGGISVWYDTILEDIFLKVRGNNFLHNWLKTTVPELVFYEYELWSGHSGNSETTTLIPSNHAQKDLVLDNFDILINTFFASNEEKAKEVKEVFLEKIILENGKL
jgi:hypothetical protein